MKRLILLLNICCIVLNTACAARQYDVIIVGGTPAGIMAAISAARMEKSALILERSGHIGGLPANGLGATDIDTRGATTGCFLEFTESIRTYYVEKYGADSQQVKDCKEGYYFEPHVAEFVFEQMLATYPQITVLKNRQFDVLPKNITVNNDCIKTIRVVNRSTIKDETYSASVFIDATYEGDLAAAAGVPYKLGREAQAEHNEVGAGKIYKFWDGPEIDSLSTHEGDSAIQAYNFRLNLTKRPDLKIDFTKPDSYNRNEYISLIDDLEFNRRQDVGPMKQGIAVVVNSVTIPNGKVDANNQHAALISTDLPQENYHWPEADWQWRDKFSQRLKSYIQGLLYFAATDSELPESFRKQVCEWGFSNDEYGDNGNFPRQVYVREGRRIVGLHLFTTNDALPVKEGQRPPVYPSSITAGHYSLDSHATRKREEGIPVLEGFLSYKTKPYTIPMEVIIPTKVNNLLCPVPVSGTHIGFSTLRMEPCWMAMGQASGIMAAIMMSENVAAKDIPVCEVQKKLLKQKATLIYFEDVKLSDPDFVMVQVMGLQGYFPTYRAELDRVIESDVLDRWQKACTVKLNAQAGVTTRRDVIKQIYHNLENNTNR